MLTNKKFVLRFLVSISLLLIGCRANIDGNNDLINNDQLENDGGNDSYVENENITTITTKSYDEMLSKTGDEKDKVDSEEETDIEIFGTWNLEKVVLKSDAYDGTDKEALGGIDEEDYVGLELEFTDKYLRLGKDEYLNPEYILENMKVPEYNDGGKFRLPSFYEFIENENINIVNSEKYESWSELPLKFYQVKLKDDYFIPVGTQVILLNNDTILVGIWGKIILAHRV